LGGFMLNEAIVILNASIQPQSHSYRAAFFNPV
jgi:hypothetical protein